MKTTIKLIAFFVYTIGLFCINDFYLLAFLGIVQILIMFVCRISIKEATKTIMHLMPFILFTVVIDPNGIRRSHTNWNSINSGLSYDISFW